MRRIALVLFFGIFPCSSFFPLAAQSPTASVNGQVRDASGAVLQNADVQLIEDRTNVSHATKTSREGIYAFSNIPPGHYHLQVSKAGFKTLIKPDIVLNVLDALAINFDLPVGAISQTVTVEGGGSVVNTESASVSTVVDRQFAENLPMNGRSFQTLIELSPGVVLTTSSTASAGQFSVNGQRADSNYVMVDGVSANIGISSSPLSSASDAFSGSVGGFSAQGGTNSLVSVDAMQEFRIQTSTFAPEFGRTPGGQISIVTRSGTNQFHGTVYDYFRNDALDASSWFNGFTNVPPLRKAEERQNDFGGTFSGPILRNRTFFFFSYEALRLRLPQTALSFVPDASYTPGTTNSRQNTIPAMQTFMNAFPLPGPNSPEILCNPSTDFYCPASGETGTAALNTSFSNRSKLDAASLRLDHRVNDKLTFFGRYNYSPSSLVERPGASGGVQLSQVETIRVPTQTSTIGVTWIASPTLTNDLRANYSRVDSSSAYTLDNFGGAVPFLSSAAGLPSPYTNQNSEVNIALTSPFTQLFAGNGKTAQTQRQLNVVDSASLQMNSHTLKFGIDYRRLMPSTNSPAYLQGAFFNDVSDMESGTLVGAVVYSSNRVPLALQNLGLFAQDTWRVRPRLTLTYGLRWDVDFTPRTSSGPSLPSIENFNNPASLALAPAGTPVFSTQYANIAPRIGVAYQLLQRKGWESVLRGGWGLFYDLATTNLQIGGFFYPFGSFNILSSAQYPIDPASAEPALISPNNAEVYGLDPKLKAPYTQEWNLAFEQSVGAAQSISATYTGAAGRRLLISEIYSAPSPNVAYAQLVSNYGTSDYDALQLQFRRRLTEGLQVLASYSWAHSIDTGSTGSGGVSSGDLYSPQLGANSNRGPSDFDIRNSASAALTYDIPAFHGNRLLQALARGWSTQNTFQARSAAPVNAVFPAFGVYFIGSTAVPIRPDVVPGQPHYLNAAQCLQVLPNPCPGGKGLNPAAFTPPPLDPTTGQPTRQGDLGRNALRAFGAWQWDFALHRDFQIYEQTKLQFRVEIFNLLNHPNFGPPNAALGYPNFGWSTQTLGQSLNAGNDGGGGFSTLYQLGGPRSVQLALKLEF